MTQPFITTLAGIACVAYLAACGGGSGSSPVAIASAPVLRAPAPSPSAGGTATPSPGASASGKASPTPTGTPSPTRSGQPAPTPAPSTVPSRSPSPTPAPVLSPTPTPIPVPSVLPSTTAVSARPADSIVDMIGIGTHASYNDTIYRFLTPGNPAPNGDSVLSSLETLGVRHVRDGVHLGATPAYCQAFAQAYAAGIDLDLVTLVGDTAPVFAAASACFGPAMVSIEGPNELDLYSKDFAASNVAEMAALAAARGTAFGANVKLYAPSLATGCLAYRAEAAISGDAIANDIDSNNAHVYFGEFNPENTGTGDFQCGIGYYGTEATTLKSAQLAAPSKPVVVTETGYSDNCCMLNDGGVSPAVKTKYTLRTLLAHYLNGVRYAYIYELASDSQSYGLTDNYLNPKPSYTALENFIRILRDPGGSVAGSLQFGLSASLAGAQTVLLQKRDGSYWLVLWQTTSSWNPQTHLPIAVPPLSGTIGFRTPPSALTLYTFNPSDGTVTPTVLPTGYIVNLSISDTPEILEIGTTAAPPVLATPQPPVY